jgi:hypothetical protein
MRTNLPTCVIPAQAGIQAHVSCVLDEFYAGSRIGARPEGASLVRDDGAGEAFGSSRNACSIPPGKTPAHSRQRRDGRGRRT